MDLGFRQASVTAWRPGYKHTSVTAKTPAVLLDFKNGTYAIGGVAKTLAEVCEQNTVWNPWDPSSVVAGVGLTTVNDGDWYGPVLTAAAKAALLSGYVAVMEYDLQGYTCEVDLTLVDLPGFNNQVDFVGRAALDALPGDEGQTTVSVAGDTAGVQTPASGPYKIALRCDGTQVALCLNGNQIGEGPQDVGTTPTDIAISVGMSAGSGGIAAIVSKITFYLASDYEVLDLPVLST